MPFSLFINAHGAPGSVLLPGSGRDSPGREVIPAPALVQLLLGMLPLDVRRFCRHVHFDSCSTMAGAKRRDLDQLDHPSVRHVSVSGYTIDNFVTPALSFLPRLLHQLSHAIYELEDHTQLLGDAPIAAVLESAKKTILVHAESAEGDMLKHLKVV